MNEPRHENNNESAAERRGSPTMPAIWVGSLADYNAGHLHGAWIDAAQPHEDLLAAVQHMLSTSREPNAEEWGIFDHDNFGSYRVGEYEDLATVSAIARGIQRFGLAYAAWAELSDAALEDLDDNFEDAFMGYFDSQDSFIDSFLDDFDIERSLEKALPGWLLSHISIDRQGIGRDLQASGDLHFEDAPEGGIYVFRL